ncbi:hypothetical protein D3C71_1754130 [compost metagenome]
MREAVRDGMLFIGRVAWPGEGIRHPHIMGKAYTTRVFGLVAGKAHRIFIFVAGGEQVQFISNGPGVQLQLKEQLVYC